MTSQKIIYILLISLFTITVHQAQTKDSTVVVNGENRLFLGVDIANPIAGFFSDKKNYNGYLSYRIKNKWLFAAEVGYEKNIYKKNGWNIDGKGFFTTVGFNYIISNNYERTGEGFYLGARIGFSPYNQKINMLPIKDMNSLGQIQTIETRSLPEKNVSSGWFEAVAGAKVKLGNSPFYLDFLVKPKFEIFSNKQDNIDNLVIPGYGKDKGTANLSFIWGISYKVF